MGNKYQRTVSKTLRFQRKGMWDREKGNKNVDKHEDMLVPRDAHFYWIYCVSKWTVLSVHYFRHFVCIFSLIVNLFLAVQNSSIGDLVTDSLTN